MSANDSFCKEINTIEVQKCTKNGNRLIIEGRNLYKGSTLLVNAKKVDFEFIDDGTLSISTSNLGEGNNTLRLELVDNQNNIIAKSNEFIFK